MQIQATPPLVLGIKPKAPHTRQVLYYWATSPTCSDPDSAEEYWEKILGFGFKSWPCYYIHPQPIQAQVSSLGPDQGTDQI